MLLAIATMAVILAVTTVLAVVAYRRLFMMED